MAAKTVNKSEEIRKAMKANPDMKNQEIVELLGKKGIEVAPAAVSNIRTKEFGGKRGKKSKNNGNSDLAMFVLRNGGDVGKLIKEVEKIQSNSLIDFVLENGGPSKTIESLTQLQTAIKG